MDVLMSETCWALNKEIIKQVTSSWSIFTQLWQRDYEQCRNFPCVPKRTFFFSNNISFRKQQTLSSWGHSMYLLWYIPVRCAAGYVHTASFQRTAVRLLPLYSTVITEISRPTYIDMYLIWQADFTLISGQGVNTYQQSGGNMSYRPL